MNPYEKGLDRNEANYTAGRLEEGMTVKDLNTLEPVPGDGETMGEIMFKGKIQKFLLRERAKSTTAIE